MAVLEILQIPDPRLKRPAKKVTDINAVQGLIDDMLETMYHTDDGIGLASTQVGSEDSVIIIDLSENRDEPMILVNPEIVESEGSIMGEEGCLSIPEYRASVERFEKVAVTALDREGNEFRVESDDFLAIVLQHEIDHLKGKVFTDYLSPLKQQRALKKVQKAARYAKQSA